MSTGHTFRRLRLAMLLLGSLVGLGFPSVAYYAFGVTTAETVSFHVLCIVTGLMVGTANYALFYGVVSRHMSRIAGSMREFADACARGEPVPPPRVNDPSHDALGRMQHAFWALARVVTDQLEKERLARGLVDALAETVDLEQTCRALLGQLEKICGASLGIVYVRTPGGWKRCASFGVDLSDTPELLDADSPLAAAAMEGPHTHQVGDQLRWLRVPTLLGTVVPNQVHTFGVGLDDEPVALVTYACHGPTPENLLSKLRLFEREAGVHIANARLHHQLSELAAIDELTQLLNRRFGRRRLGEAHSLASRSGTSLGIAMIDIDHFKRFNDAHGHAAGDAVLSAVARALSVAVRQYDSIVRWGGEEILLIAPDTSDAEMAVLAERLRSAVENIRVDWQGVELNVTVSVGTATGGARHTAEALVAHADEALYRAKQEGRNRVVEYGAPETALSLVPAGIPASSR